MHLILGKLYPLLVSCRVNTATVYQNWKDKTFHFTEKKSFSWTGEVQAQLEGALKDGGPKNDNALRLVSRSG